MARLPSFKRLFRGDYEETYQSLIDRLGASLNSGIESLFNALNNNLTLNDNLAVNVKEFDYVATASGGSKTTVAFPVSFVGQATGLQVLKVDNTTNSAAGIAGGVTVIYSQSDRIITINQITGLITGNTYRIRVAIWQ